MSLLTQQDQNCHERDASALQEAPILISPDATAMQRQVMRGDTEAILSREPLTAEHFAAELGETARCVELRDFDIADIPEPILEDWRMKYKNVWDDMKLLDNLRGQVGEVMFHSALTRQLSEQMRDLTLVTPQDIDLHDESFHVTKRGPYGIYFECRRRSTNLEGFIELDMLFGQRLQTNP